MTKEEFDSLIEEQKGKGMSEEDIVKAFCIMFKEGDLDREQLEACLAGVGYELTGELAEATDEELKEKLITEDKESKEEAKEDERGEPAPAAPKGEAKDEPKEEEEVVEEKKTEDKADGNKKEEEKKEAIKLFGL